MYRNGGRVNVGTGMRVYLLVQCKYRNKDVLIRYKVGTGMQVYLRIIVGTGSGVYIRHRVRYS